MYPISLIQNFAYRAGLLRRNNPGTIKQRPNIIEDHKVSLIQQYNLYREFAHKIIVDIKES